MRAAERWPLPDPTEPARWLSTVGVRLAIDERRRRRRWGFLGLARDGCAVGDRRRSGPVAGALETRPANSRRDHPDHARRLLPGRGCRDAGGAARHGRELDLARPRARFARSSAEMPDLDTEPLRAPVAARRSGARRSRAAGRRSSGRGPEHGSRSAWPGPHRWSWSLLVWSPRRRCRSVRSRPGHRHSRREVSARRSARATSRSRSRPPRARTSWASQSKSRRRLAMTGARIRRPLACPWRRSRTDRLWDQRAHLRRSPRAVVGAPVRDHHARAGRTVNRGIQEDGLAPVRCGDKRHRDVP